MKFSKRLYNSFCLFFFFFALVLTAGIVEKEVTFNIDDLTFSSLEGYDLVKLKGCKSTVEIGAPLLPRASFSILIPQGAEVVDIEVVSFAKEEITGEYNIYPTQHPQPFLKDKVFPSVEPDKDIYASNLPYPEKIAENPKTGSMGGYKLASLLVYPLQYIPAEKKLVFYSKIKLKITYEEKTRSLNIKTKTEKQNRIFKERVRNLILNPEDIGMFEPTLRLQGSLDLPADNIEYVIITVDSFQTAFQELADWKTKKGIPAKVVTLDSIYANYTGADNAEMVRNFIIDANSTWGTIWVLLGGQCDYEWGQEIVPRRNVWYRTVDGDETDTIPSDLYFSDLDGDWNADGDGVYGESTDDVDLYSDVFVGRAPVRTVAQAETFVNKVLTYEKSPPYGYQKKIILPAAYLWPGSYDERTSQEAIADMIPGDWQVSKLYERDGALTHEAFVDSVRSGFGFAHLVGHGNQYGIYTYYADAYLNSDDLDALNNDSLFGIHNSIGCMCGALDFVPYGDCFAEHYLTPSTGGSYSIMNSRYGWGHPPSMGPSEHIDTCFYHEIFRENYTYHDHVGVAHALSKDGYVSEVTWGGVWAWCIYELNLFGDPEMPLWTDIPGELTVTHDAVIPIGGSSFTVNVTDAGFGVEGALVCLYKEGEVYQKEYTDASGNITLILSPPPNSLGVMYCTVTKNNYIPYEGTVDVISPSGPWVIFEEYTVIDASGNSDNNVDPGESIELPLTVHNVGLGDASGVTGTIRTEDSYVTLIDSIEDFGDILSDSLSISLEDFDFDVPPGCPANHVINFQLIASDINDSTWNSYFSVPISTPDIALPVDTLDFDTTYIGYPDTLDLLVNNVGTDTLRVSNITSDNIEYSIDISNFNVPPGESQTVGVIFSPASEVVSTGNLTLESNDLDEPSLTVFLQGEGLLPPDISVSPDSLSDSLFTGETSTHTLVIRNNGASDLNFNILIEELDTTTTFVDFFADKSLKTHKVVAFGKPVPLEELKSEAFPFLPQSTEVTDDLIDKDKPFESNNLDLTARSLAIGEEVFGNDDNEFFSGPRTRGNLFTCNTSTTLIEHRLYLNPSSSTQLWFLVYEGESQVGTYNLISASDVTPAGPGLGWYSSGEVDVPLEEGKYYLIVASFEELSNYYNQQGISPYPIPASFGELTAGAGWSWAPSTVFPPASAISVPSDAFGDPVAYYQTLVTGRWIYSDSSSGIISAEDSMLIDVTFDATGLNGGDYFADIMISSNDPDESEINVPAYLHVTGVPDISISEDTLDYGIVFTGYSSTDTLIVSNDGTDILTVSDISSDNSDFNVDISNFTVNPGETQAVAVICTPSTVGTITGNLTITSDDPDEPSLNVFLQGEGLEPPDISVSPDSLSDSLFTGDTSIDTLTIYNTGNSDLNFNISVEALAAATNISFRVTDFENDKSPTSAENSATGNESRAEFSKRIYESDAAALSFENILVMEEGPGLYHYDTALDNLGLSRTLVTSWSALLTELNSGVPWELVIVNSYSNGPPNEVLNSLNAYQENGGFLIYSDWALFAYTSHSLLTSLGIDFVTDFTTPLNFYAVDQGHMIFNNPNDIDSLYWTDNQYVIDCEIVDVLAGATQLAYFEGYPDNGAIVLNAEENCLFNAFQSMNFNADDDSDGKLDIVELIENEIVFLSFSWLSPEPTSGTVPADDSMIVEVTFDATGLNGGDYFADIIINSNDPDEPELVVPSHLHVTGAPDIAVSEDTLDYGIVFNGYSATDTLIVSNEGTDLLTVSDIVSDNPDYTVDITNFTLNPEENRQVAVNFEPTSLGIITGNLTITSDDPSDPIVTVFLQGECLEPPDISVSPESLSDSLFTGETSTDTLTVYNTGGSDLFFDISIDEIVLEVLSKTSPDMTPLQSRQFEYLEVGKGEEDTRKGDPVVLGAGGPDTFGYTWMDSDEGGSCQFYWVDISSTGTQVTGLSDDSYVGPYPISFEFTFYDSVYTEFYISSNGFIGFGPTSGYSNLSNQPIPTSNSPNNIIAWCWDDLYPRGSVYYEDFGDRLIVQFVDYGEYGGSGRINAEVILHRSGQITIQYLNSYDGFDLLGNTVGIENMPGDDGLQVAFNTGYIHDSLAVEFSIGPSWLSVEPVSDTIPSDDSVKVEVTFDATGLYGGDYFANILINSNDPDEPELVVPSHLNVTGAPDIVVSTDSLDYGIVFTGYSSTDTLIVSNEGTDLLTVSDIVSDNSDFTVDITNFTLDPGEEQEVVVTFTPGSLGTITGNLTITSDDPDVPSLTIFLQGECLEPPDISVSPESLSDTLLTGDTSIDTLTIYNTGESDLDFVITIEGGGSSYALEFDGVDDYVEVPDHPSLSAIGGAFTLEFWMNVGEDPIQSRKILGKWGTGGSSDDEYAIDIPTSSLLELSISGASGGMTEIRSKPILPYTWTHVAGVFDSASASLKIFINGTLDSNRTTNTLTMNRDTDQPLRMGTDDFGALPNFRGQLDEVRIWNIARTEGEIQANMNQELSGTETGLVGYWKFNEGSGNTVYDSSPNNNDGTLYGGTSWILSSSPVVNWIYVDTTSGTVPAGDSMIVEVTFDATDLSRGDYYANIIITSNDPDEPEVVVPSHLHVAGAPDIAVSADTLDYGTVFPGYSSSDTLIVSNEGTDPLTVNDISSDNSDYTIDTTNFILNPGENKEVTITFTPSSSGIIMGNLSIISDDPVEPTLAICLMGECIEPPVISVSYDSLSDTLNQEETATHTLTIYNTGVMDLIFDISIGGIPLPLLSTSKTPDGKISLSSQFDYLEVKKGEEDTRKGDPVILSVGGPDSFGYTWMDSDEGGSCQFEWVDISSTGTEVTGLSDDNFTGPYPISFEFPFYDSVYTEFYISSNGFIGFGPISGYSNYSNQPIPTNNAPNNIIAWCWDDLYPNGSVYYEDSGDKLIIQFMDYGEYGGSGRINAEVILYRSGQITIQYLDAYNDFDLLGNTVGIENIPGSDGLQVAFNTGYIHDSLAVKFTIGPKWLSATPVSDTISSGDSVFVEITFDATDMAAGDHYTDIVIASNDPENPEISVLAHLHVRAAGIEEEIPKVFFVKQNYPNPFSSTTAIQFGCPEPTNVCILIYDVMGRVVRELIDEKVEAGYHCIIWDGTTKSGRKVSNAVYFYRMVTDKGFNDTKKMIHLQ